MLFYFPPRAQVLKDDYGPSQKNANFDDQKIIACDLVRPLKIFLLSELILVASELHSGWFRLMFV